MKKRRSHEAGFKARAMLEAIKGARARAELATRYGVHAQCMLLPIEQV